MTEKDMPLNDLFLKGIFSARNWEAYFSRTKILSSADPEPWSSVDFPVEVAVELSNRCNLKCVMCPVPDLKRTRGFMNESAFQKIVGDLTAEKGFLFLPQGFGESLLHPDWKQFIKHARSHDIQPITVLTNGMLLRGETISTITESVDIVVVTLDGSTAKTYESLRVNSNFEQVNENIKSLLRMRGKSARPHCVIRIIRMQDTEKEIDDFRAYWSNEIGAGDIIQVSECIDWAGSVGYRGVRKDQEQKKRNPCRMLWKNLTVYHDGRVSPCCYDAEGELIIGNVLQQSLREIWSGSPLKELRELHLMHHYGRIPICSRCKNWQ